MASALEELIKQDGFVRKLGLTENCKQTILNRIQENPQSFFKVFCLLKKHIDEEEKKDHSDDVDITFVAHGSIRLPMVPAGSLLPLSSIRDVVLYSPWNCVSLSLTYGIATGKIRPQHRVFYCDTRKGCTVPDGNHHPTNLPNHWNSLKHARGWVIPTIMLSPLQAKDGAWETYEYLMRKNGPPGRNRIVIPFIVPGQKSESVPFFVVTLALSLVLLSSRFKATVHLDACLSDQSGEVKLHENYLKQQYAYAIDNTGLKVSRDMLSGTCGVI